MCVRYVGVEARNGRWSLAPKTAAERELRAGGSLFPGETGAFATHDGELVEARWGLQPSWAKAPHFGRKNAYNARSETLTEKPTFRNAFKQRRCVIPAAAFYERAEGRWLRVEPAQGDLFLFAALWEAPNERTEGLPTYTMVTTTPNKAVEEVHDRMPVVLSIEDAGGWMDPDAVLDELSALLLPCPPEWTRIEDSGPISRKKEKPKEPGLF